MQKKETIQDNNEPVYPIGGYAPGEYFCICSTCNEKYIGARRSFQCLACGTKSKAEWDALTPGQQEERLKRNVEIYNEFIKTYSSNEQLPGTDQVCGKTELNNLAAILNQQKQNDE